MRDRFIAQLTEQVKKDRDICLITGDLGFGVFNQFREDHAGNFINAGVAEQHMTGLATGMAMAGKKAVTYSIGNFPTLRCLEQIRNDACYHDANVKVVSIGGGFSYGALGISHHATEDLAIMRSLPALTVLSPCTLWEVQEATKVMMETDGTFFLRLDKSKGEDLPEGKEGSFELGKMRTLREGSDVSIFVTGGILEEVQEAADLLQERGVSAQILSVHTIKPLDKKSILSAIQQNRHICSVEEHSTHGGLGSAIAEVVVDEHVYPESFLRIGLEAGFSSIVGSQKYLRQQYKMDAESIVSRILKQLKKD